MPHVENPALFALIDLALACARTLPADADASRHLATLLERYRDNAEGDPREWDDACEAALADEAEHQTEILDATVCVASCLLEDGDIIILGAHVRRALEAAAACLPADDTALQNALVHWGSFRR